MIGIIIQITKCNPNEKYKIERKRTERIYPVRSLRKNNIAAKVQLDFCRHKLTMKLLMITKKYYKDGKLLTGFTIIEMVVVMAVFLFVVGAAIGIFLSIIQQQKKVLAEQQFLNQISYVEEYMSKALRMAEKDSSSDPSSACLIDNSSTSPDPGQTHKNYSYLLTRPENGFFTGIKFINASDEGRCCEFYLDTTTTPYVLKQIKSPNGSSDNNDSDAVALTASGMKINFVRFGIDRTTGCLGSCPIGDQDPNYSFFQPRVTMLLNVSIPGDSQSARTIQTTISQRNLNVQ
jgi:type II secretory pathway pseudopilin PulG